MRRAPGLTWLPRRGIAEIATGFAVWAVPTARVQARTRSGHGTGMPHGEATSPASCHVISIPSPLEAQAMYRLTPPWQ